MRCKPDGFFGGENPFAVRRTEFSVETSPQGCASPKSTMSRVRFPVTTFKGWVLAGERSVAWLPLGATRSFESGNRNAHVAIRGLEKSQWESRVLSPALTQAATA